MFGRMPVTTRKPEKGIGTFDQVVSGYSLQHAIAEGKFAAKRINEQLKDE